MAQKNFIQLVFVCIAAALFFITIAVTGSINSAESAEYQTLKHATRPMHAYITSVDSSTKPKVFRIVLLCDTPEKRTQGLQGFRKLKKNEAALFVFDQAGLVSFWMGTVAYPIDIIFVGLDKKVVQVFSSCQPGSRALYPSGQPAKWVIETAAGSGIKIGDRVSFQ
ncbi:MAG: DUF192 domain-containing protein [Nitrospirota bacterium]